MAIIRNLVVKISADISSLSKGLQRASKNLEKVSRSFTKIGTSLTTKITMPLIGLGTIIAKTSTEFEQSMANAASVAGASAEELERMKTIAREMGAKTVFSASQAADALYYMASAGYKVDQMADSIEATLNLASATQFDLAQTTDIVIASLNQFGLEASEATRVTNVFASAIGNSMATMDKISNSMGYVGPVAHSLGYEIEEVVGALSILYNAGYEGSTAGTTLRQVLVNLMNPTSAALEVFEDLGLSFEDLNPAAVDFATIVGRLGDAGITTSQAMKIFGARGGPGMLALISQGSDAINDMTTSITGTNKASEMAAIQLDTLSGQFKILKSELEEVAISFGDILIPIIRNFISQYISPLTKILMSLSNEQKMQAVRIAMIAAAIGPLFLAIGKVISILAVAIKILPIVFSKAGLIIAVIALLASSFIHLYKTNEEFREKVLGVWERVKSRLADITNKIKTWLTGAFQAIKENISGILIKIATNTIKAFNKIYEVAIFVWDYLGDIISTVIGIFGQAWDRHGEATVSAIVRGFTFIGSVIETIGSYIQHIAERIFPLLKKIVVDTFSGIKGAISKDGGAVISTLKNAFSFLYSILSKTANSIVKAYGRMFESLAPAWEKVKEMFKTLYETIKDIYRTLKPIFNLIGVAIIVLYSIFMGTMNAALSAISPLVQAVVAAVNVILNIIRALLALLRGDFSEAWEYLKRAVVGVWETIKQVGLAIY